jgi:TonB-dependent SusC/RagA subfamily outer membrane receptor
MMMIKKITVQLICLVMLTTLSQMLNSQSINMEGQELTDFPELINSVHDEINLVFYKESPGNITSPVTVIDVEKELQRDQRANLGDLLNGKVPGIFGAYNTWGTGNSVVLVDGIPQGSFYLNSLSLLEIESVVVLKDALSKAMYGAQGDAGIILVNTKRGRAGAHKFRVIGEYGGATPRAMPKYLNAADYMEKYNQAQTNDGVDPSSLRYTQEAIDGTRSGENPARYPDNNFYSSDYIKEYTTGAEVFADVSGGDPLLCKFRMESEQWLAQYPSG